MGTEPTWEEVLNRLSTTTATTAIALSVEPPILVLVDPATTSIGLVGASSANPPTSATRLARGVRLQPHGPGQTAVWVDEHDLLKPGLEFLLVVSRRILEHGEPLYDAVEAQLESWRDLVAAIKETEVAAAIGVLGELVFLRAALELKHDASSWVGMAGGAIDFRFDALECEVKTTTSSHHEHIIHGADQLQPSVGSELVLVSILVATAEAGYGTSINALIADIATHGVNQSRLETSLESVRHVSVADPVADLGFVLRVPPIGFAVNSALPALTSGAIQGLFGADAARIRDVQYRLRLDGLAATTSANIASLLANVRL